MTSRNMYVLGRATIQKDKELEVTILGCLLSIRHWAATLFPICYQLESD